MTLPTRTILPSTTPPSTRSARPSRSNSGGRRQLEMPAATHTPSAPVGQSLAQNRFTTAEWNIDGVGSEVGWRLDHSLLCAGTAQSRGHNAKVEKNAVSTRWRPSGGTIRRLARARVQDVRKEFRQPAMMEREAAGCGEQPMLPNAEEAQTSDLRAKYGTFVRSHSIPPHSQGGGFGLGSRQGRSS